MERSEIEAFFGFVASGQWNEVKEYLHEDFEIEGLRLPVTGPAAWDQFLGVVLKAAPNLRFSLGDFSEGDEAEFSGRLSGTHTGPLVIPGMPMGLPATGMRIDVPVEDGLMSFQDGRLVRLRFGNLFDGGFQGLLTRILSGG